MNPDRLARSIITFFAVLTITTLVLAFFLQTK